MRTDHFWNSEVQVQRFYTDLSHNGQKSQWSKGNDEDDEDERARLISAAATTFGERLNALPPEILAEIFFWCTPSAGSQEHFPVRGAMTISHVCSLWRSIAIDTPRLWTYTKIPVVQHKLDPTLALLRMYLERAKRCVVFVDIDFVDIWTYYRPVLILFEEIVEKVKMMRPPEDIEDSFLATHLEASSTEDRPYREEWYFWSARPSSSSSSNRQQIQQTSGRGPSTSSMMIGGKSDVSQRAAITLRAFRLAVGSFVLEPYLPQSNSLTYLVLRDLNNYTNLTPHTAALILSSFPLLVHCTLHIDFTDAGVLPGEGAVHMQHLMSLSLSWSDWVDTGSLLDTLTVPSLRELELIGRVPDVSPTSNSSTPDGHWPHLIRLLARNRPRLEHLILEQIDLFHVPLLPTLAYLSNLQGLWLDDCLIDDEIIRGLGPTITSGLRTFVGIDCYQLDARVFADVVRSASEGRSADIPPLSVYVDGTDPLCVDDVVKIQEMGPALSEFNIGPKSMPVDLLAESEEEHSEEGSPYCSSCSSS